MTPKLPPAVPTVSAAVPKQLQSEADTHSARLSDSYLMRMLGRFLRPYAWHVAAVLALMLAASLLNLVPPYLVQLAVDGPIIQGDAGGLWLLGGLYFAAVGAAFVLRFGQQILLQTVGQNALANLRQHTFEHILKQDLRFFNTTPVGQIVARMTNDIESLTELLSTSVVMVISNLITLVGILVVMFAINWQLALLGLSVLPIMIAATVYFRTRIRKGASGWHRAVADYLSYLNEQLNGMSVVQLFNRQPLSRADFETRNLAYRDSHMNWRDTYTWYTVALQGLTVVGMAALLWGGGQGVLGGWATLGTLIAFVEYLRRCFDPLMQLAEQFGQIQTALSAGERIGKMLAVQPQIVSPDAGDAPLTPARASDTEELAAVALNTMQPALSLPAQPPARGRNPKRGTVLLADVHFSYVDTAPVLRGVTLHIPAGQRVAIVGATGAGKTSLAGLLTRFYDVTDGRILIDGIDVRDYPLGELRTRVTVVPQNPYCFNGTLGENLKLFNPSISDEAMQRAAELACAAPFIARLPQGYDYPLLPSAANLSHGQRQLLALARALLHHPHSILVLDEATSNIDTETEHAIQQGLQHVLANRTSIVIAHRLSTIRDADRILVLHRGQVVEDGAHAALLAHNGLYARLYRRQFAAQNSAAD
jgi:ATP-binding cassette, subfamily B, multidrug efflux pump